MISILDVNDNLKTSLLKQYVNIIPMQIGSWPRSLRWVDNLVMEVVTKVISMVSTYHIHSYETTLLSDLWKGHT
jgi:hypothetical protein